MSTIQLLIDDVGNREAVRAMLEDRYELEGAGSVREADLYLVDDRSFPAYHDGLHERVEDCQPVFCPVVLICRDRGDGRVSLPDPDAEGGPLLVDDVVDAPLDRTRLFRRLNTHLVRRRQSVDLRDSVERLEESNRALEQFAYAASHDLQEPLRMVSSYLRLIERRYGDQFDEEGEEFLEFAVDGADRMRDMIEGLLEYSRVDSAGQQLEATDLETVVEDVLADLGLKIEEHDADVEVGSLPRVRGDPDQLRQLFQNLVSNAIEYSGEDDPNVVITADRCSELDAQTDGGDEDRGVQPPEDRRPREGIGDEAWVISVSDDGVGIDPDDQERIFEVFERLHSHGDCAGTGIGLALCKRIVDRHGGEIWVESEPGDGSVFQITLPPAPPANG